MTRAPDPMGSPSGVPDPAADAPRPPLTAPRSGARPPAPQGRSPLFSKVLVIILVLLFLLGSVAFIVSVSNARPEPTRAPDPSPQAMAAEVAVLDPTALPSLLPDAPVPLPSPTPHGDAAGVAPPAPTTAPEDPAIAVDASLAPAEPEAIVELRMPFVPVVDFWSAQSEISRDDLVAALRGESGDFRKVVIPTGDREAIAGALGIEIAASVEELTPEEIEKTVGRKEVLGILRASDVTFRVRTLGIGKADLFGNERMGKLDAWPIVATVTGPASSAWDQKATWTLVAGGDSFTDRGIHDRVVLRGRGLDYPFDGGYARVTGHYCCGPYVTPGRPVPRYEFLGGKGVVRAMVKDADLAIVNHEAPVPDDWDFHLHGFIFSGKPELTQIFTRAGIDWVSLANNHIKDYGSQGVIDTRKNLAKYGLKFGGAGKNVREARQVDPLEVNGVRIAIIPCNDVASYSFATKTDGGAFPCKKKTVAKDIAKWRERVDIVIVFPHWGIEYDRDPTVYQREMADAWTEAGADLILGAHSHVAGGIEEIDGTPVFYSLGNFIFDQNWATYTMESFLLEITLHGSEIVQLRMHPYLIHEQSQPHFLDPAKDDGLAIMKAVRRASILDW